MIKGTGPKDFDSYVLEYMNATLEGNGNVLVMWMPMILDTETMTKELYTKNMNTLPEKYTRDDSRISIYKSRLRMYAELLEFFALKSRNEF